MRLLRSMAILVLVVGQSFGQQIQMGLDEYVEFVKVAPGENISQKVDWLTRQGISLSDQGRRELDASVARPARRAPMAPAWPGPARPRYGASHRGPYTPPKPYIPAVPTPVPMEFPAPTTVPGPVSQTLYAFDDGTTGSSVTFGDQSFYNLSNGLSGSTTRLGNQAFTYWSDGLSGTTTRLGNQTFTNWNNGLGYSTTTLGNKCFTTSMTERSARRSDWATRRSRILAMEDRALPPGL